jgi:hypothetical protein
MESSGWLRRYRVYRILEHRFSSQVALQRLPLPPRRRGHYGASREDYCTGSLGENSVQSRLEVIVSSQLTPLVGREELAVYEVPAVQGCLMNKDAPIMKSAGTYRHRQQYKRGGIDSNTCNGLVPYLPNWAWPMIWHVLEPP